MKFSMPNIIVRLEGLAVLAFGILLYFHFGGKWSWVWLILWPDIGIIGFLLGNKVGSIIYNIFHFYVFPLSLIAYSLISGQGNVLLLAGLLWTAHIGMDRFFGFGLKYPSAFRDTHIQRI